MKMKYALNKKEWKEFLLIDSSISIKHIPQHSKADSSQ